MTVIKINAITVPADSGDELATRFAGRAGAIDGQPGFEGFELLRPTDDRRVWLVLTRWSDEESYTAWTESSGFARAHGGRPKDAETGRAGRPGDTGPDAHSTRPVGLSAELWSYEVAGGSDAER